MAKRNIFSAKLKLSAPVGEDIEDEGAIVKALEMALWHLEDTDDVRAFDIDVAVFATDVEEPDGV